MIPVRASKTYIATRWKQNSSRREFTLTPNFMDFLNICWLNLISKDYFTVKILNYFPSHHIVILKILYNKNNFPTKILLRNEFEYLKVS